jgi:hypothetical protein
MGWQLVTDATITPKEGSPGHSLSTMLHEERTMIHTPFMKVAVFASAMVLFHAAAARTQGPALEKSIEELFKKKDYSPTLFPVEAFDVKDVEPLLVLAAWETVRPELEKLAQNSLNLSNGPNLRLRLVQVGKEKKAAQQFRFVFDFIENTRLRDALTSVLRLQAKSFLGFGEEISPGDSGLISSVTANNPQAPKALDVNQLRTGVQEFLKKDPALNKFGLVLTDPDPKTPKERFVAQTAWVLLKAVEKPRPMEFSWRVSITFEKAKTDAEASGLDEVWRLRTAVEIGRKPSGQKLTEVIQDTDQAYQFGYWLNATIGKPLPAKVAATRTISTPLSSGPPPPAQTMPLPGAKGDAFLRQGDGKLVAPVLESPLTAIATTVFEGTERLILEQTQWALVQPPRPQNKSLLQK